MMCEMYVGVKYVMELLYTCKFLVSDCLESVQQAPACRLPTVSVLNLGPEKTEVVNVRVYHKVAGKIPNTY